MVTKTYFVMMRGNKKALLPIVLDVLPGSKILWAGTGDWIIDAPWILPPTSGQVWDLCLVLETEHHHHHVNRKFKAHTELFATEVVPTEWKPTEAEMKMAEEMLPKNEPRGLLTVYRRNWGQVLSVHGIARNVLRVARIITWLLLCILHWKLFHPFHMINLLKFRDEKESAKETYDEYRDAAGMMVLAKGGKMAFLGQVKSSDSKAWDELMVVAYKSRWQFFQMALLTPSYWPLAMLRDEGLSDGGLIAVEPIAVGK